MPSSRRERAVFSRSRYWRLASFRSAGAVYGRRRFSASLRLGVGRPFPAVTAGLAGAGLPVSAGLGSTWTAESAAPELRRLNTRPAYRDRPVTPGHSQSLPAGRRNDRPRLRAGTAGLA